MEDMNACVCGNPVSSQGDLCRHCLNRVQVAVGAIPMPEDDEEPGDLRRGVWGVLVLAVVVVGIVVVRLSV